MMLSANYSSSFRPRRDQDCLKEQDDRMSYSLDAASAAEEERLRRVIEATSLDDVLWVQAVLRLPGTSPIGE